MPNRHQKLSRPEFEHLVREHHACVYRSALRIVRDDATALDVTQQVYVALLEGRITLSGEDDERALRWIAVRSALHELRGTSNRRVHEGEFAMQRENVSDQDHVADEDAARAIERMVGSLPEGLRLAVRLRFDEGLTYAAIGDALAIAEPSAYGRVQRALERLRERLSAAGLGSFAIGLEDRLVNSAAMPSSPVPAHVASKLLTLHAAASTSALLSAGGIALALTLVAATVVSWIAFSGAHAPTNPVGELGGVGTVREPVAQDRLAPPASQDEPMRTSLATAPAAQDSTSVPPSAGPAPEREGTLRGVLVDDQGQPARGFVLVAASVESAGKFAHWVARATTAVDGSFAITVPVAPDRARPYGIDLEKRAAPDGFDGLENRGKDRFVTAEAGKVVDVGKLWLHPAPRDEAGAFTLLVHMVDEHGTPIVGATATIFRGVPSPDGWSPRTWEAGGRSDAGGIVRLEGEHVGAKHLHVDGRSLGYRTLDRDLSIAVGAHDETVTLARGLEIAGTLRDVDGHVVARGTEPANNGLDIQVYARAASAPDDWIFAAVDGQGAFVLQGLDEAEYDLEVQGGPWSRVCRSGVRAGTLDVALRLKRDDDPRDVGDHCAEIHARLVDAVTRQPVDAGPDAVEVVELSAGATRASFDAENAPLLLQSVPRQVMWVGGVPKKSDHVRRTGLEDGTYAFVVRVPGYAAAFAAPLALASHALRSDIEIALVRPVEIRGRVLDVDGTPVAGAYLMFSGSGTPGENALRDADENVRATEGKPNRERYALFATEADGSFRIPQVTPGLTYTVCALHAHREPVRGRPVATPASDVVEIRFTRAR